MNFFKRLTSARESNNAFNDALTIYQSLRQYPVFSSQYREALLKVASLSQEAIKKSERNGDAHVLLANTYHLLYIDMDTTIIPLEFAASVIRHWFDEPMKQHPWTKNVDNGLYIYNIISDGIQTNQPDLNSSVEKEMIRLKAQYYSIAITDKGILYLRGEMEK